ILGVLRNRLGRAVRVINNIVAQRFWHGDLVARKIFVPVRVVVVRVAVQERIDVIGALLLVLDDGIDQKERKTALVGAGLGEQRHIGGRRAERRPRGLFIGKIPREVIRWPAGPFEHFAGIVWAVLDLVGGGERLYLGFRKAGAAGIRQIAESDQFEGMTIGTNLVIDLKPPPKL